MQPTLKRLLSITSVFLFLLVLLIVWAAPIDLHIAHSQTNTAHTLSTASTAEPDAQLLQTQGIEIQLVATDHQVVESALTQQLTTRLAQRLPIQKITLTNHNGDTTATSPLLLIEVTNSDSTWTPLWADANITVSVVYASDGDVSWRDAASMHMATNEPTVHARGTIELTDASRGLFSQFGYQKHLGRALGEELYKMMESPLFDPPGS